MKVFKYTVPEPDHSSAALPLKLQRLLLWGNPAVCAFLTICYLLTCNNFSMGFVFFYGATLMWFFFVSPFALLIQSGFAIKSALTKTSDWRNHSLAIVLTIAAFIVFCGGMYAGCVVSV